MYVTAADSMKVKPFNFLNDMQPAWWDIDCENLKQRKYSLLRLFLLTNLDSDIQQD